MKVEKVVEYAVKVKAVMDEEGNLNLSLTAVAPYGNRTATATVDEFPEEVQQKVAEVLMDVISTYGEQAVLLAEREATMAHSKALALGEAV